MTITNRQLISDALAMIGVLAETEVASAEQAQLGLRFLNAGVAEWQAIGLIPSYYTQTELTNDCPIEDADILTVTGLLGVRLALMHKGSDPSRASAVAKAGYDRLVRTLVQDSVTELDMSHLPQSPYTTNILDG